MLKYNQNVRNGSAKARMWMICHVTALTVSFGFTSHAAALQEGEVQAVRMSGVGTVFSGHSAPEISRKVADVDVKAAAEVEESLNKMEEEAAVLEAKRKAEEQEMAEEGAAVCADQTSESVVSVGGGDYEKELLASIIFCEAGNQSFTGQVAVGAVVMNRIASSAYPNTMEEVIYQSGQFGPAVSGWLDQVRSTGGYTESAMQAAEAAMAGENPIGGCLYFDQGGYGMQIGAHYFH